MRTRLLERLNWVRLGECRCNKIMKLNLPFPAIPLPPMAPEVTDWSEHHMKLSWKEPIDDGGAAVTGYHVEAKSRYALSRRSHVTKYVHNR